MDAAPGPASAPVERLEAEPPRAPSPAPKPAASPDPAARPARAAANDLKESTPRAAPQSRVSPSPSTGAKHEGKKQAELDGRFRGGNVGDSLEGQGGVVGGVVGGDLADETRRAPSPIEVTGRENFDWGGVAYLSNDDSMSLASAQRVLWALAHGRYVAPRDIRKHELLNYFSFDTVDPAPGRTFGVLGTAEQKGDQLTVALAIRGAKPVRPPLDLTVVVDRSGSMSAEGKLDFTKRGLHELVHNLRPGDRIDLVEFDDAVCTPIEGLVVGRDPAEVLDRAIDALRPGGSTNLDAGLREAWRIQESRDAQEVRGRDRRVLLVTDAELNAGNVDEDLVSEIGRKLDQGGIHLSGVGVGQDFNSEMLEKLTEKGRGANVFLGSEAVVDRVLGSGFDALVSTVADDVHFSLDLPPSLAMKKFYGEESSTVKADVKPVEFHAGTAQLFLQDLQIRDARVVPEDPITLRIDYKDPVTQEVKLEELRTTVGALLDADHHNVDKGQALMAFSDWVVALEDNEGACGAPVQSWWRDASPLRDDAEIRYVDGLVSQFCGASPIAEARPPVELKVKLDSDVPVDGVALRCGSGEELRRTLTASDSVARFEVAPGACTVELQAVTPMTAALSVPEIGAEVWCRVRGGRMSCG
jgi:Ca-activated chloride channel family protein